MQVVHELARIEYLLPELLQHTTCGVEQLCALLPATAWHEVVRQKHSIGPYITGTRGQEGGVGAALHLVLPAGQEAAGGEVGDLPLAMVWIQHAEVDEHADESTAAAGPSYILCNMVSARVDLLLDSAALRGHGCISLNKQCLMLTSATDVRGLKFKGAY